MTFEDLTTGGPVDPVRERVHDDNYVLNELKNNFLDNKDAFENPINTRTNVLDLAAHYPISPERFTLSVDGSRVFPQYGGVAQYTHDLDRHLLQPAAGETVTLRSAERPRYVVQYELAVTWAFKINQSLQEGDSIQVGAYDGSDGYYLEQTGSHADDQADFVMERQGTEVYRKENQDLIRALTEFSRFKLQTGWYNTTRQVWSQSYPGQNPRSNETESIQFNEVVSTGDMGEKRGPATGNLPIHFEVTASSNTTDLELEAGSAAQVNLGTARQFNRVKKIFNVDSVTVTDEWEPVRAFRIDPDRHIVNVQFSNIAVGKYTASADVELLLMAADPSKVLDANGDPLTDADFGTPEELSAQNNVMQQSAAVEQFPDNTGTPQTSMTDPGGWQLGRSELLNASGNDIASSTSLETNAKRPIYGRDYGVILLKSDTTGDASYVIQTEQDW